MACGLPLFTADGLLPVGDYPMTLPLLRASHLVSGDGVGVSNVGRGLAWATGQRVRDDDRPTVAGGH